jgi:L-gulonate 3-dehydrogenase
MKVAIIGAGLIGRAWAIVFARGAAEVVLYDQVSEQSQAALDWADAALAEMARFGLVDKPAQVRERISVAATLADAVGDADHIQENIVELAGPKQALFAEIEKIARADAILASSSSAIMPSVIFGGLATQGRCLVVHPMNPPHLSPVAEVCGAAFTRPDVIEKASHFMRLCGMSVVMVEREIEGFILNRLQFAVLNEAFRLIDGGYVSAADLDKTLKDGLALRWSFMGPIETIDLNAPGGIGDYMKRYGSMIRHNGELQKQSADWREAVVQMLVSERRGALPFHQLAEAQMRRDKSLMALAKFKASGLPS